MMWESEALAEYNRREAYAYHDPRDDDGQEDYGSDWDDDEPDDDMTTEIEAIERDIDVISGTIQTLMWQQQALRARSEALSRQNNPS
jgi:hypothetical protein